MAEPVAAAQKGAHACTDVLISARSNVKKQVSSATTYAVAPRITLVGEVLGEYLGALTRLSDVYQPHPVLAGVETMRWLPTETGLETLFVKTGAKWNLTRRWLLNANLLIRLTDTGLRARVTPSVSIAYAFER